VNRSLATRMIGLVVVVLAGFSYILFEVIGVQVGAQRFSVSVMLPRAGGIYPEADVTYRGVAVGKVTNLTLELQGELVSMAIDPGTKIPTNSTASVRELSAAGEQYMDLVPTAPNGPFLKSGSIIPESQASVPTNIATTLIDFGQLLQSVHTTDIATVTDFLSTGLGGTGEDLRAVIADSTNLLNALQAAAPATAQIINGGQTALQTAQATSADFATFSHDLNLLSARLAASNPDLQALVTNGDAAATQLDQLLAATNQSMESLTSSSAVIANLAAARSAGLQAMLEVLPVVANQLGQTVSGGQIRGELLYNDGQTVCPYLPSSQIAGPTQPTGAASLTNACNKTAPDLLQRGAANAPTPPGG